MKDNEIGLLNIFFCFGSLFGMCVLDISKDKWEKMTGANGWNSVELRDNRYNQIVHMVSAAEGAEEFYSTEVSAIDRAYFFFAVRHYLN